MELRQLKYFLAIAGSGSFSEASRRCCLSQSAISQQIKVLEDELGARLFERTSHRIALTESGEVLLPLAHQIVKGAEECKKRVADVSSLLTGELTIGLTPSLESYVRWAMLRFMKLYPRVRLNVKYKTIPELIQLMRNRQLDMALSIIVEDDVSWVESEPVMEIRMFAVMRNTHPLARRASLSFKDLRQQPIVLPEDGLQNRNAVERFLCDEADGLNVRAVVNDACALLQLIKYNNCITIMSERSAQNISELTVVPIDELQEPHVFYAHFLKGAYRKRSATVFLEMLKQVVREEQVIQGK